MKKLLLAAAAMIVAFAAQAKKDKQWNCTAIADSLKKDAHAVIRSKDVTVKVVGPDQLLLTNYMVVTILDKEGVAAGGMSVESDKIIQLLDYQGVLYDSTGAVIRKTTKDEWVSVPSSPESYAYSEMVEKRHYFNPVTFPYTVAYTVTQKIHSAFYLPDFATLSKSGVSLEQASYTLDCPVDWPFTSYLWQVAAPTVKEDAGRKTYAWLITGLKPMYKQSGALAVSDRAPHLILSPGQFEMGGVTGDMTSWKAYGTFYALLNKGRDVLPAPKAAEVKQIAAGCKDTLEMITRLYQNLQRNNRYVNVMLGIGGFQTHDAAYVAEKNFGDCKALTNYMKAMLGSIGIPSYYVLAYAGEDGNLETMADFSNSSFNHVLLGIPRFKDTLYLECTSPLDPVGYVSLFTQNRNVLWVSEAGGALRRTPAHQAANNTAASYCLLDLTSGVPNEAVCRSQLKGFFAEPWLGMNMKTNQNDLVALWNPLHESLRGNKLSFTNGSDKIPSVAIEAAINPSTLAQVTAKRIMVSATGLSSYPGLLPETDKPLLDLNFTRTYTMSDTLDLVIPDGYTLEYLPTDIKHTAPVGQYSLGFIKNDNHLLMVRNYTRYQGQFKAPVYKEWSDFILAISKADKTKAVLVKKSGS